MRNNAPFGRCQCLAVSEIPRPACNGSVFCIRGIFKSNRQTKTNLIRDYFKSGNRSANFYGYKIGGINTIERRADNHSYGIFACRNIIYISVIHGCIHKIINRNRCAIVIISKLQVMVIEVTVK